MNSFNTFIADISKDLKKGRTVTCYYRYQVEELDKIFKNLVFKKIEVNDYVIYRCRLKEGL